MAALQSRVDELQRLVAAQAGASSPEDAAARHAELLLAIRQLQLTVETPIETTSRINFQIMQNICIRISIERGYLQAIAARDGQPVTTAELAAETQTDELLIIRTLRVVAAVGLIDEDGPSRYAANNKTAYKVTPGGIGAEKHHFDLDFAMGGRLVDYMRGPGIEQFADEPGQQTLFDYAMGSRTIFDLMQRHAEQKKSFDDYMAGRRLPSDKHWFDFFPASKKFAESKADVLLVDIAGGPGQELRRFHERFPEMHGRLILQDLPITLKRIEPLPPGIEAMEYDFFTPQPIKGARAYFMRDVLHNWSDAQAVKFLGRIADAMDPSTSTLVIEDYVLPNSKADLRAAEMDILMWLHTSGLERTLNQWERLLGKVGLELVHVWPHAGGAESVLEIQKKA